MKIRLVFYIFILAICESQGIFPEEINSTQTPATTVPEKQKKYDYQGDIDVLIKKDLNKNSRKISILARDYLNEDEKYGLYYINKKSNEGLLLLNLFLGFGIGSFVQKDSVGGTIILLTDLLGLSLYVSALQVSYSYFDALYYSGFLVIMASRIFAVIRPITFVNQYNDNLKKILRISVNVVPYINLVEVAPMNREPVYGAAFSAKF